MARLVGGIYVYSQLRIIRKTTNNQYYINFGDHMRLDTATWITSSY